MKLSFIGKRWSTVLYIDKLTHEALKPWFCCNIVTPWWWNTGERSYALPRKPGTAACGKNSHSYGKSPWSYAKSQGIAAPNHHSPPVFSSLLIATGATRLHPIQTTASVTDKSSLLCTEGNYFGVQFQFRMDIIIYRYIYIYSSRGSISQLKGRIIPWLSL